MKLMSLESLIKLLSESKEVSEKFKRKRDNDMGKKLP